MNVSLRRFSQFLLLLGPVAILGACTVPHKLKRPELSETVSLTTLHVPTRKDWPARDWWHSYNDRQLQTLMTMALTHSPSLAEARSRVQIARKSVQLAAAQAGLSMAGNAQLQRQRISEHGLMPPKALGFTWYNQADLGVQIKADFDWWGKKQAAIDAALDQAHAAQAKRNAAALIIEHKVAATYFGYLADQARLALARQAVNIQRQWLRIAHLRVAQRVDDPDTLWQATSRLANARQACIAIASSARIRIISLAALIGVPAKELPALKPHPLPAVSSALPANASIDLVARRADITASRWQVEAAIRQTERARAQFFPDISLTALIGLSSTNQGVPRMFGGNGSGGNLGNLFKTGSRVFNLAPAIHLPIFESGRLKAAYGVSRAQLNTAVTQYRTIVNDAVREVATQAIMAQHMAARRVQQSILLHAEHVLFTHAKARVQQGVRDIRVRLAAHVQYLGQEDAAIQLHAQALSIDLALIKALGGGYRTPSTTSIPSPY